MEFAEVETAGRGRTGCHKWDTESILALSSPVLSQSHSHKETAASLCHSISIVVLREVILREVRAYQLI